MKNSLNFLYMYTYFLVIKDSLFLYFQFHKIKILEIIVVKSTTFI